LIVGPVRFDLLDILVSDQSKDFNVETSQCFIDRLPVHR
jgi:hypothetical protein